MSKRYLLGLDNGGTVVKAALYDVNGNALACARTGIRPILGTNGEVERDMAALWAANCAVLREVVQKAGINSADILGVSVSGHGNGLYLVDADARPVRNGIYSTDVRAKAFIRRLEKTGVIQSMFEKTMLVAYAGQPGPLLRHLQQHEPDAIKKAKWALGCNDYIRFCLTGEAYAEITNASAGGVLNQSSLRYDESLFEAMEIPDCFRLFPPLLPSSGICGVISARAAEETGLPAGTPVAGGMIDIIACAIATGITDESRLCLIAGTWSVNEYISKQAPLARDLMLKSAYCIDGYYLVMDGSTTSASNLEWFVQDFLQFERTQMEAQGKTVYDAGNALVGSVMQEECGVIFLPFLYGTNVEVEARSCFLGLNGRYHKAHTMRAIYEGVVFSHKTHIERLLRYRDRPQAVRIAGGAAKSPIWVQMFADALQLPIEVSGGEELGTMGAAMCVGVAVGVFPSLLEAAGVFAKTSYVCEPDPSKKTLYEQKYVLYQKAIGCLAPLWAEEQS